MIVFMSMVAALIIFIFIGVIHGNEEYRKMASSCRGYCWLLPKKRDVILSSVIVCASICVAIGLLFVLGWVLIQQGSIK